ncbi:MAG TPA: hypothetical protein VJQ55_08575 [Candidatus Binatia bacterium]|nr:hypothetical protein [Candidatus Binatia bacterium]
MKKPEHEIVDGFHQGPAKDKFSGERDDTEDEDDQDDDKKYAANF